MNIYRKFHAAFIVALTIGLFTVIAAVPAGAVIFNPCDLLDKGGIFYQQYCGSVVSGSPYSQTIGAPGIVTNTVITNLVLPAAQPKAVKRPKLFGAVLKYEDVTFKGSGTDVTGSVYGTVIGLSADNDKFTYGIMVPYDYMKFNNSTVHNVNQIGSIIYGKYRVLDNENYALALSANGNYMYSDINFANGSDRINTLGAGVGATFTLHAGETVIPSIGLTYQYNHDDTDIKEYHFLKTGLNVGFLPSEKVAINVFTIYNIDASTYPRGLTKDNYFDIGAEFSYLISDAFNLTLGFKSVAGLKNYASNMYYFGALIQF